MENTEKLNKLIDLLTEFLQIESLREGNEDGSHNFFIGKLSELLDLPKKDEAPKNQGLTTRNSPLC